MSKIIGTTKFLLKRNLTCKKISLFILFLCFVIIPYAVPAVCTAKVHSWRLSPFFFVFLCNDPFAYMLITGGALFLFLDPLLVPQQIYELDCMKRISGSVLYVFAVSFIYALMILVVSIVAIIPVISLEQDWGLGWKMLAFSRVNDYPGLLSFDTQIMKNYTALNAIILSCLLIWAFLIFLGLVSCLYNTIKPKSSPVYVCLILIILDTSIYNMYLSKLMKYSPMTLSVLSTYNRETKQQYGISLQYACVYYAVLITVLILLCICSIKLQKHIKTHRISST